MSLPLGPGDTHEAPTTVTPKRQTPKTKSRGQDETTSEMKVLLDVQSTVRSLEKMIWKLVDGTGASTSNNIIKVEDPQYIVSTIRLNCTRILLIFAYYYTG